MSDIYSRDFDISLLYCSEVLRKYYGRSGYYLVKRDLKSIDLSSIEETNF